MEQRASVERPQLAESRRAAISDVLRRSGSVTVARIETEFAVSSMTARRDLAELERQGLAHRTHGGAVLPAIAAHEDSFTQRLEAEAEAKAALAEAALQLVAPRESIFFDSSTSAYFVARRILEEGMGATFITNSLPVMDLVATSANPNVELVGAGGSFRRLTRSYVGPLAVAAVRNHFADRLFLSVKGVAADGSLTDADPLEAEVKRAMIEHAEEAVLLLDRSKLAARGLSAVVPASRLSTILTHGVPSGGLQSLRAPGVRVERVDGKSR